MKNSKLLIPILISIIISFTGCNIELESSAVDTNTYLNQGITSSDIYDTNAEKIFISPFNFGHTDFGKLILIHINNHPTIKTVELVVQKDKKGAFVVVFYHNGKVENYINPGVTLDKKYLKPNFDWVIAETQDFDFTFEDTKQGLAVTFDVKIKTGEHIKIKLKENQTTLKRYAFLATIGADLNEVKRFPFIFLSNAGFIPIENTEIDFKIDDKSMQITKVPIKVEGEKCFKVVYSLNPLAFFWNEERNANFKIEHKTDDIVYELFDNSGFQEIKSITYNANNHKSTYRFSPSFPLISAMKNNTEVNGKFSLGVDNIEGIIGGEYTVKKENENILIKFEPKKCWQPMRGKDWVSAYTYNAIVRVISNDSLNIKSEWIIEK